MDILLLDPVFRIVCWTDGRLRAGVVKVRTDFGFVEFFFCVEL